MHLDLDTLDAGHCCFLSLKTVDSSNMYSFQKSCALVLATALSKCFLTVGFQVFVGPRVRTNHALWMSQSGKGFGSSPPPAPKKEPLKTEPEKTSSETAQVQVAAPSAPVMNQGQKALEKMRREQAEKRDAELRKVKQIRDVDDIVREDPSAAAIPEKVAMRMGKRMLPFVGLPLFGSMAAFVAFWYLATYKDMEFQPGLVAGSTIGILAIGLLGITYSVMSASWDEDREGSGLGIDEFSRNVDNLKGGLQRSRENAVIREQMAGLPEAEIEAAIRDLDRRDQQKAKKQQNKSLESKLDNELK